MESAVLTINDARMYFGTQNPAAALGARSFNLELMATDWRNGYWTLVECPNPDCRRWFWVQDGRGAVCVACQPPDWEKG